jgi:hypothetical protein
MEDLEMNDPRIKKIETELRLKRRELISLQRELMRTQHHIIKSLPQKLGVSNIDEVIGLVMTLASPELSQKWRLLEPSSANENLGRKKNVRVTPEIRRIVIEKLKTQMTAISVAQQLGISFSSVNKIKQQEGLTRSRTRR